MSTTPDITTAEADVLYGMLTQRAYLRTDDPEHEIVLALRDKLYPLTTAAAETSEAREIIEAPPVNERMQPLDVEQLVTRVERIEQPTVHTFDSTGEAYDVSQCSDEIKNGDVLVVPDEDAIAIMLEAWPTAISPELSGENFHEGTAQLDFSRVKSVTHDDVTYDYSESVKLAQQIKTTGLADDADLDLPADVVEPIDKPREPFEIVGPAHMGYAIREIESSEYLIDAIESVLDADEHLRHANADDSLNIYYEHVDGGGNDPQRDLASGIAAFDSLVAMYPDIYARLHWSDDHDLVVREHVPSRYEQRPDCSLDAAE
jgi:hypothetical protein